ncbi:MAG: oligopeptide transporter, OPT family [Thermoanaerobaculia bacterium]|nr:oligopeptide transporter, OPT family [Thermoanaerobaculia bacterium]
MDAPETKSLPENAYRPLKDGERYEPLVPATARVEEGSWRAIAWGLFLCVVFTVASAYSGLKVGQVMEASIPISILAIGLARVYGRRSTVLENVIISGVGGTSGAMVAGAVFTLPALYILKLDPHPLQTTFICLAGACLGVLFLIPLRRYFVRDMHGEFPYPEATAITEVLVTGERGGSQAKLLLQATGISAAYDFLLTTFHTWRETLDFRFLPYVEQLKEKARMAIGFDAVALILGLGYVMGLRSSMILCAGGVLSNFILVPLIWMVGQNFPEAVYPGTVPISGMDATAIFRGYVRFIGVGAIASAGILGIIKSLKIVVGSFKVAAQTFKGGAKVEERTDRDLPIAWVIGGILVATLAAGVFLSTLGVGLTATLVGLLLVLLFSFFFTSVAANAIAYTARNPVSGMTMLTIIVSSVVLLKFGVSGTSGMFFVMAIAGMVCTALSLSGQTITDLKTGYWLGSTPAVQEKLKFWGILVSAVAAALTVVLLAQTNQFGEAVPGDLRPVLPAPQASLMKALVEGFMSQQPVAYILFGVGAMVTLVMEMLGVPALLFALGMYLPLNLNLPALVGGFLAHWVTGRSERLGGERGRGLRERGVIIASGLMAGGALGGVFGALLRLTDGYNEEGIKSAVSGFYAGFGGENAAQIVSLVLFLGLCVYVWRGATREKAG